MSFGQLNQWLEKCDATQTSKRLYADPDTQSMFLEELHVVETLSLSLIQIQQNGRVQNGATFRENTRMSFVCRRYFVVFFSFDLR